MSDARERPPRARGLDVARRAGVSQATVSLALADPTSTRVSQATRARIEQIAEELGYRPQRAGRQLRSGRTGLLLLAVPDVRASFFARVLHGAQKAGAGQESSIVLGSGWSTDDLRAASREGRFDGMVVCSPLDGLALDDQSPTRTIVLDGDPRLPGADAVVELDVAHGMRLLVDHVRSLGHRSIGRLESSIPAYTFRRRQQAFDDATHGLAVLREPVDLRDGIAGSSASAMRLLDRADRPSAIVCDDDVIAAGVYHAARRCGLSIPGDVSVVGMDDAPTAALMDPALTTIWLPGEDLGAAAVRWLLADPGDEPEPVVPTPRLVVRDSTRRV